MIIKDLCKVLLILAISTPISYSAVSDSTRNDIIDKQIIIVLDDSKEITAIDAKKVNSIRMDLEQPSAKKDNISDKSFDKSFKKEKAFGPALGLIGFGPCIIGLNADIKNVNLFATTSFILPILSEGEMYAFTIGGGRLIGIGKRGWKFNLFSHLSVVMDKEYYYNEDSYTPYTYKYNEEMRWETNYAAGVGVGFQYTTGKGLLFSFKVPVVGFNFLSREIEGEDVALYYLYSGASMPMVAFGWSF
jgi:hypothetical protein